MKLVKNQSRFEPGDM